MPTIPVDFSQLSAWLIMPAVLTLLANIAINAFAKQAQPSTQNLVKFVVYLLVALLSFGLTKLSPDFVASIQPLWAIVAAVIAAYYATNAVRQVWFALKLLGIRLALGQARAQVEFNQEVSKRDNVGMMKPMTAHG